MSSTFCMYVVNYGVSNAMLQADFHSVTILILLATDDVDEDHSGLKTKSKTTCVSLSNYTSQTIVCIWEKRIKDAQFIAKCIHSNLMSNCN